MRDELCGDLPRYWAAVIAGALFTGLFRFSGASFGERLKMRGCAENEHVTMLLHTSFQPVGVADSFAAKRVPADVDQATCPFQTVASQRAKQPRTARSDHARSRTPIVRDDTRQAQCTCAPCATRTHSHGRLEPCACVERDVRE